MYFGFWMFLTIGALACIPIAIIASVQTHKRKMKQLEIEALRIKQLNIKNEVEDAVERQLADQKSRIEVLEAIVTDNKYQLNEKIKRLK